jgi:hypothetical protein
MQLAWKYAAKRKALEVPAAKHPCCRGDVSKGETKRMPADCLFEAGSFVLGACPPAHRSSRGEIMATSKALIPAGELASRKVRFPNEPDEY